MTADSRDAAADLGDADPHKSQVVGFDLDMTLVDSSRGIIDCMQRALSARGVHASEDQLWPLMGAPLLDNLAFFLPADQVEAAAADYRAAYLIHAVEVTTAMPGAAELVHGIQDFGGVVMVVSAKNPVAVQAVLDHVDIHPDVVVGDLFAHDKAGPLRRHEADVYVGDHVGDMYAAAAAGAFAIGVTTGPHDEQTLRTAGADLVIPALSDLLERLPDLRTAPPSSVR
ncbi:HAD family hydrolase [Rudaeicoccus suwonensis]|uniref:Phosphoglycolate phosphatase n=1 Tax=Rudaeicoccus suwonensis TaxID=657409 RepID=A0A561DVG3_9MICO|nr:HAD hydrolase-like protein [Rudaeicoccus suwonensis]TWE07342.1 phosphoglycolate phosphatase [Rudaeicoccus suwonensis]